MVKKKTAKPKSKTVAGVAVAPKPRKKNAPRTAYSKEHPSPHAFQPGMPSANPGGKPHHADALLSRSLRACLCDRAPDAVAEAMQCSKGASWSQCIAKKLVVMAVRGDLSAISEIRNFTESAHVSLDFPDSTSPAPIFQLCFMESDGAGRLRPCDAAMVAADAKLAPLELPAEV